MNIHFYFQEVNTAGREELEKHLAGKKLERLTRLLLHGNLALAKFIVNAKYHKRHNVFAVRLGLKIIKNDFESEEVGRNLIETFDLAFNRLVYQLRKAEKLKHGK